MKALATNTFATVSFNKNAQFDFESLVAEFQQALDDGLSGPTRMRRIGGQFVSFDMGRAQLSLAYSSATIERDSQPAHQASLAVYVSAGETADKPLSSEERAGLCKGVLDRIAAVQPCDHRVWGETDRDIRPLYNADLTEDTNTVVLPHSTNVADRVIRPRRIPKQVKSRRWRPSGPADVVVPLHTQSAAPNTASSPVRPTYPMNHANRIRQARASAQGQPRALPRQVALGLPQTELRDLTILRNVFLPDHDDAHTPAREQPVAHRLAIYTLTTSLVVICLPVGAAMFSYCALGRENLNMVGRAMALTGIGIALAKSTLASAVLPLIG